MVKVSNIGILRTEKRILLLILTCERDKQKKTRVHRQIESLNQAFQLMSTNIHIYRRVIFLLPPPKKKKKKVYHPLPFFLDLIITSPYSFLSKRSKYVAIISHFSINNLPPSTLYLCGTQVGIKCQLPPPSYAFGVICFFLGGGRGWERKTVFKYISMCGNCKQECIYLLLKPISLILILNGRVKEKQLVFFFPHNL